MRGSKSTWSNFVLGVTCFEFAGSILVDLFSAPKFRPFGYVAADTFYYLSVARNIVERGSPSMDGLHATNGFHPLWQLAATLVYGVCRALGQPNQCVLAIVLVCLACALGAVWLLGRAVERAAGPLPAPFVVIPFGVYGMSVLHFYRLAARDHFAVEGGWFAWLGTFPVDGTLFSFVNGMESSLSILAFALVGFTMVRLDGVRTRGAGAACGGGLAFLCLSRLDHGAFAVFPLVVWCTELFAGLDRRRFALSAVLAFVIPMATYAAANQLYAGQMLPLSGAEKSTFPIPDTNTISEALALIKHPFSRHPIWRVFRMAPILLPMFWTVLYLALVLRVHVGSKSITIDLRTFATLFDVFLAKMAPGVFILGCYDLFFVTSNGIGEWYQPVSTLYMSLTAVSAYVAMKTLWRRYSLRRVGFRGASVASAVAVFTMSALVIWGFVRFHRHADYHRKFAELFWNDSPRVREAFGGNVPNLLEVDDGIVGFSLRAPAMSGSRLGLDREALLAARSGHLVDVAVGRGFSSLTTFVYGQHSLTRNSSEEAAKTWAKELSGEDLSAYRTSVSYGDEFVTIVALTKRED